MLKPCKRLFKLTAFALLLSVQSAAQTRQEVQLFFSLIDEQGGFSAASLGGIEGVPRIIPVRPFQVESIRIGLNPTRFSDGQVVREFDTSSEQNHSRVEISSGSGFILFDAARRQRFRLDAVSSIAVARSPGGLKISWSGGEFSIDFSGPTAIFPLSGLLRVDSLRRRNLNRAGLPFEAPQYRSYLEVIPGSDPDTVRLVNVLPLEEYLLGVINNEMPAFFHPEALAAQAVAARGFALSNLGRFALRGFDLDDSTLSQVYRGAKSESPAGAAAVEATRGIIATRRGRPFPMLFSSSMGGHTEANEWIFNAPAEQLPGRNPEPALRAIHDADFPLPADLSTEEGSTLFYGESWDHFDSPERSGNTLYRWRRTRTPAEIAARLRSSFGLSVGEIVDIRPTLRGPSGRIAEVEIAGTNGRVRIRRWDNLRLLFTLPGALPGQTMPESMPNSPSTIIRNLDASGRVASFTLLGGGWGHNVGMSQFGAHGRGRAGSNFAEILEAYYQGIELSTQPIEIGWRPEFFPFRLNFIPPFGRAILVLENRGLRGLTLLFNRGLDISSLPLLPREQLEVDISSLLVPGENQLEIVPDGVHGSCVVYIVVARK